MTPFNPAPSMHEVMTGYFTPNAADTALGILAGFGATVNIMSEGAECGTGGAENSAATSREQYYSSFCQLFGVEPLANLTCANMSFFTTDGSAALPNQFFAPDSTNKNRC